MFIFRISCAYEIAHIDRMCRVNCSRSLVRVQSGAKNKLQPNGKSSSVHSVTRENVVVSQPYIFAARIFLSNFQTRIDFCYLLLCCRKMSSKHLRVAATLVFFYSFVHIVFPRLYRLWLTFPLECSFIFVFSCDRKTFLSQFCRCVLRCYLRSVIIVIVCSMGNSSRETRRFYLSIPKRRHTLWRFSKEQDFLYLWVFFQF